MKKFILLLLCFFMFSMPALAYDEDSLADSINISNAQQALPADTAKSLTTFSIFSYDTEDILKDIFKLDDTLSSFKSNISVIIKLFILTFIASISNSFILASEVNTGKTINIIVILSALSIILTDVTGNITSTVECLNNLDIFSKALSPTITTALLITGQVIPITSIASIISLTVFISFITNILVKLLYIYIVLITLDACLDNKIFANLSNFIKDLISSSLKLFLTVYLTYSGLVISISAATNTAILKTAKFAVSTAVPVIGGIISDATESYIYGANVIKNSVGVFGLLAVLAICLFPIIKSLIAYIVFKLGSGLVSIISDTSIVKFFIGMSEAIGMSLAMLFCASSAFFFQIVIIILFTGA